METIAQNNNMIITFIMIYMQLQGLYVYTKNTYNFTSRFRNKGNYICLRCTNPELTLFITVYTQVKPVTKANSFFIPPPCTTCLLLRYNEQFKNRNQFVCNGRSNFRSNNFFKIYLLSYPLNTYSSIFSSSIAKLCNGCWECNFLLKKSIQR